jgi:predicted signal transduction protein with EAL and GGDEF domain
LGCGAPVLWFLIRVYSTLRELWDKWVRSEFRKHGEVYLVVSIVAIGLCSLIGYFIGRDRDETEEESLRVRDSNLELTELASTDGLTGLFNSRYIHERLNEEIENAYRSPLTCLLVDIDHFKKINDTHGHPFGDTVLVEVARLLKNAVRGADAVGRLGGEEFLVLLPHTPIARAAVWMRPPAKPAMVK